MNTQNLVRSIRLIITFYRSHFLVNMLINLACVIILFRWGLVAFQGTLWLKFISYGIIYFLIDPLQKQRYFYYRNLGLGKSILWTVTLSMDFILYISLIILTYHLR